MDSLLDQHAGLHPQEGSQPPSEKLNLSQAYYRTEKKARQQDHERR